ncbi:signal peptidase I [bacterium]|nr:signal peptidase I [bacterium]
MEMKMTKSKSLFREYSEALAVAFLMAMALRTFAVEAFRIPTGSMEDTLLVGDFLLVNKFVYGAKSKINIPIVDVNIDLGFSLPAVKDPKPGDVVVFIYPVNQKDNYIKRCVAVGGQSLEIKNGVLYIDGKEFINPPLAKFDGRPRRPAGHGDYGIWPQTKPWNKDNYGPIKVPEGHFFMMGDNRDNSLDSRFWGFVKREEIVGEALVIYFSWNSDGTFFDLVRWTRIGSLIK